MTSTTLPMPFTQLALLLLGGDSHQVRDSVRLVLRRYIERVRGLHEDLLAAIDGCRGGPCLPFELNDDERLVACALALNVRESNSSGCAIFSRLSQIDAGTLLIPGRGKILYLDDSAPELDKLAAWFYPSGRDRYLALVGALTEAAQLAKTIVGKRVSIEIPVTRTTAGALKRRSVTVSLVGAQFEGTPADQLRGADAGVTFGEQSVTVEIGRPEAVLRLSAAAELGRWLRLESGDEFRAYVRLKPFGSVSRELDSVVSAMELNRQFLHSECMYPIDAPAELWSAAWTSGRLRASSLTPAAMSHWQQQGLLST